MKMFLRALFKHVHMHQGPSKTLVMSRGPTSRVSKPCSRRPSILRLSMAEWSLLPTAVPRQCTTVTSASLGLFSPHLI